ncbi:WavE lipopolysaccharide synthesis family protein [Vibrio europaeus]|uniref:WavE lipopolysaccharide synthesis family protein n=1 Tax=Vibrio europaeus TaxID=300876 RepID=UPI0023414B0A|nr:WavE lipopolysaccharide synthesis family protein [Vibrio europaeus]MDC5850468.1 WavE lipopolysaccharide synthesis family protein [Vibrio europaeus]
MNKIADKDITFVVQGPVQASKDRKHLLGITEQCLRSIRDHFPESKIILSTWKGQPHQGLGYNLVLELDDPGPNFIYYGDERIQLNNNRQLHSSHMGLAKVETKFAVKMRSDNLLTGRGFVELYEKYSGTPRDSKHALLNSRVVTSSTFFISSHVGREVHFHKSDLFDFGETADLLKIWNGNFVPELRFNKVSGYKSRYPATEQFLCLSWISRLLGIDIMLNTKAGDHAGLGKEYWKKFVANNLIVDLPENIGLDVTERFYNRGNLALEIDLADWKEFSGIENRSWDNKRLKRTLKKYESQVLRFFLDKSNRHA